MAGKSTVLFPAFCGRGVKVEKNRTNDMTTGNPIKLIIMFMITMFLGNIFQQFYNIVDSIVAGQFIGVDALAAIGSTGSLMFFVTGWLNGLSSGFGIIVAQMFGAKKYDDMRHFVAMSIYLMFGFAAAMTVGFLVFNVPILKLMNSPADLMGDVAGYMGIIYAGLLVTAAYNTLAAFLRALGDSKSPLYFLIISAGINVILDVVLIRFVGMGVEGCAYATVIAQGVSAVCCLVYIKKKYPILHLEKKNFELRKGSMSKLLILGIPMGLQFSITAIGTLVIQAAVNGFGATVMAGVTAAGRLGNFLSCPIEALGQTMAPYVGQNVGAGKLDRVGKGLKAASLMGFCVSAVLLAIVVLFGRRMSVLFLDANEVEAMGYAYQYMTVTAAGYCLLTLVNTVRFTIQGMGFSGIAILAGVFEMAARTLAGTLLVAVSGYFGICMANTLAWIFADAFLIPAFFLCRRKLAKEGLE